MHKNDQHTSFRQCCKGPLLGQALVMITILLTRVEVDECDEHITYLLSCVKALCSCVFCLSTNVRLGYKWANMTNTL
jgi:hypothetical protein